MVCMVLYKLPVSMKDCVHNTSAWKDSIKNNKQTRNELTDWFYHKPLYVRVALLEAESCGMESQLDELKEVG